MPAMLLRAIALLFICPFATLATAQGADQEVVAEQSVEQESSWYGESIPVQMTPRMIIQQKAQVRAQQRMARMESLKWYGFSAARPLANVTPFMGVPSPRYEMPGGSPFSWYPYRGTTVVYIR